MNRADYRQTIKGLFGREYSATADDLYTDALLNELIDNGHYWLAEQSRCYKRPNQLYTLPVGVAGVSQVNLGVDVIGVDRRKVKAKVDGTWKAMTIYATEEELLDAYGLTLVDEQANGDPESGFFRRGNAAASMLQLVLYPGSDTSVASGVRVTEDIFPAALTDVTSPALPVGLHYRLVNPVLWHMAKLEYAEGRGEQALVQKYELLAREDVLALKLWAAAIDGGGFAW